METGHLLDTFFALARFSDEDPLAHSQNVMKALRWYKVYSHFPTFLYDTELQG